MALQNVNEKLIVTESPHVRGRKTTASVMLDVVIALLPALLAGTYFFGFRALLLTAVCVLVAVGCEWGWCKILKKPSSIGDLSAVVTGLLLAMNLPVTMPLWMAAIGSVFAIVIVKQFFGGIGHNFMNPALAARAFLLTSWAAAMTTWTAPFSDVALFSTADAVTTATPLTLVKGGAEAGCSYMDMFLGNMPGCIGEVSTVAILVGAAYLVFRHVISLRIPLTYIATVAALTFVLGGKDGLFTGDPLFHVLSGGLMLGAFFMATDYVTTPYTKKGQIIFGFGCGLITTVIRLYGGYPEGVSYSILLMNVATPLIDRFCTPRRFGAVKESKKAKEGDC